MTNRIAVMEICAGEIVMKVYELSQKKGMLLIDSFRKMVPVGKDTYVEGRISPEILNQICTAINSFKEELLIYKKAAVYVIATSAVREAKNEAMVCDQIYVRTGLKVQVLSNSEQRFVRLKGVAVREDNFKLMDKGTALVDIGSGSIQISIYEKKAMVTTQNIMIGLSKISELLTDNIYDTQQTEAVIKQVIENDIQTFEKMFLKEHVIKNLIITGDGLISCVRKCLCRGLENVASDAEVNALYEKVRGKNSMEISMMLDMPIEYASLIPSVLILAQTLLSSTKADTIFIPKTDLCDGFVIDYMEKKNIMKSEYDFTEDILTASRAVRKRYRGNQEHAQYIENTVCLMFDAMKKYHGLGKREKLLLRIAAILHDCGKFVSMSSPGECSYNIIMATEILGLSHQEREMVANITKYNTLELPDYDEFSGKLTMDQYIIVMKLAAILRAANALDRSHRQKLSNIRIKFKNSELIITGDSSEDITLEERTLKQKEKFFEEVYGLGIAVKRGRGKG